MDGLRIVKKEKSGMRRYASLFLLWSFVVLAATGLVLYVMPHGRVAYWTGWRFLGLDKDQWTALHLTFAVVMLVAGGIHLYLNWAAVLRYLGSAGKALFSKECLVSLLISLVLVVTSICSLPPSSTVVDVGERAKGIWPKPVARAPFPHAELLPLRKLCRRVGVVPQAAVTLLEKRGLKGVALDRSLKELATENHTSPDKIYALILELKGERRRNPEGRLK